MWRHASAASLHLVVVTIALCSTGVTYPATQNKEETTSTVRGLSEVGKSANAKKGTSDRTSTEETTNTTNLTDVFDDSSTTTTDFENSTNSGEPSTNVRFMLVTMLASNDTNEDYSFQMSKNDTNSSMLNDMKNTMSRKKITVLTGTMLMLMIAVGLIGIAFCFALVLWFASDKLPSPYKEQEYVYVQSAFNNHRRFEQRLSKQQQQHLLKNQRSDRKKGEPSADAAKKDKKNSASNESTKSKETGMQSSESNQRKTTSSKEKGQESSNRKKEKSSKLQLEATQRSEPRSAETQGSTQRRRTRISSQSTRIAKDPQRTERTQSDGKAQKTQRSTEEPFDVLK
ncbi:hypothetical protein Q1695_013114 [Nippostrongylus brasiliensis]|nr:hypothetical protein Q1695_013114 [Nippostrongylus brasiliensis]